MMSGEFYGLVSTLENTPEWRFNTYDHWLAFFTLMIHIHFPIVIASLSTRTRLRRIYIV